MDIGFHSARRGIQGDERDLRVRMDAVSGRQCLGSRGVDPHVLCAHADNDHQHDHDADQVRHHVDE